MAEHEAKHHPESQKLLLARKLINIVLLLGAIGVTGKFLAQLSRDTDNQSSTTSPEVFPQFGVINSNGLSGIIIRVSDETKDAHKNHPKDLGGKFTPLIELDWLEEINTQSFEEIVNSLFDFAKFQNAGPLGNGELIQLLTLSFNHGLKTPEKSAPEDPSVRLIQYKGRTIGFSADQLPTEYFDETLKFTPETKKFEWVQPAPKPLSPGEMASFLKEVIYAFNNRGIY